MEINIYQVDAFAEKPFGGNPAGVVPDARLLTEEQMQNIAREMNLSETAFIIPIDKNYYKVRFFTPKCEVDLCGHATIGAFYTLALKGYLPSIYNGTRKVYQETKAGKLCVEITFKNGKVEQVLMEQASPKSISKIDNLEFLLESINLTKDQIGIKNSFVYPEIISTGLPDIILPINNKEDLDSLKIDFGKISKLSKDLNVTGVHAFHLPDFNSRKVYTRNFAPLVGIDEEAATGTSNGGLIYFLKKNGFIKNNSIISMQGSSLNRPSTIHCYIQEKQNSYNVKVGGKAKIVLEGIMSI
ncbi:PhzF family phenazine biosynthesis protein [Tissierella sp. MSJ-40]|uniref:PhzF family phenazine biosynthesis protein n=1 Tax=Tissierella simiarum TaxID=2841534 RepID=A0ABS6E4Y8_9FIRM|nr:PhzF family phenazine biosynthesis protein [Tissierella simiarum]MBU5437984.1 PhzF family phenazine biosynthesis protein [Tissierella simiarum]